MFWKNEKKKIQKQINDLMKQGIELANSGRYEAALKIGLDIHDFAKTNPKYSSEYALSLFFLGYLCMHYKRDFSSAKTFYEGALDIYRNCQGLDHSRYAAVLHNLAILYYLTYDYDSAGELSRKASFILSKALGKHHPDYATNLRLMADIEVRIGLYDQAIENYGESLSIFRKSLGKDHLSCASVMSRLADLYLYGLNEYSKAEPLYQESLSIYRKNLRKNNSDYAFVSFALANMYHETGALDRAELLYKEGLVSITKVHGERHPKYSYILQRLGHIYAATKRYSEAFHEMQAGLIIEDDIRDEILSIGSEKQRMAFLAANRLMFFQFLSLILQEFAHSPEKVQAAMDMVIKRKSLGYEIPSAQRRAILGGKYPELEPKIRELNETIAQIGRLTLSQIHGHSSSVWQSTESMEESPVYDSKELVLKKERLEMELSRNIPEIEVSRTLTSADSRALANALPAGAVLIEFVKLLKIDFSTLPVNREAPQNSMHYMCFVLRSQETESISMIDLGKAETIDTLVTNLRTSIIQQSNSRHRIDVKFETGTDIPSKSLDLGCDLYELVFLPLLDAIGGSKKLFIIPDGDLYQIPFEVLPITKCGDTLVIDEYAIIYMNTSRDLLRAFKISNEFQTEPIVIADPDFDLRVNDYGNCSIGTIIPKIFKNSDDIQTPFSQKPHFRRLEGSRAEGENIARLLKVKPWIAEEALESRLKSCASPRILHIATHGFFLPLTGFNPSDYTDVEAEKGPFGLYEKPWEEVFNLTKIVNEITFTENPMLRSGVALAGANTWIKKERLPEKAEDGILTSLDVVGLDLLHTELVVLSACDTGLGEVLVGEGVFGLQRGFALAGAQTLVMSLWKVPDAHTRELMEYFYIRLLSGQGRAEALRDAQLAMKRKYQSPFYWGAFICQGNPGPLSNLADRGA